MRKKRQIEGYLVLKERKMYVSKNKKLRVEIIWLHHNVLVAEFYDSKILE